MNAWMTPALIVTAALLAAAVACGGPAEDDSTAQPTSETGLQSPGETAFGSRLESDDRAKYDGLPVEFQTALAEEAEAAGHDRAVQHLRDLPNETLPLTEVLSSGVFASYEDLDTSRQRSLLLDVYTDAFRVYADELGDGTVEVEAPASLFEQAVELTYDGGIVNLPPVEETLSTASRTRLDGLDTRMQRAFRTIWSYRRAQSHEVDDAVAGLERDLLAAPVDFPAANELGLSTKSLALFEEMPTDIQEWYDRLIATDLVSGKIPGDGDHFEDDLLVLLSSSVGIDAFRRGLMPTAAHAASEPIVCVLGPERWPPGATPPTDDRTVVFLPPPAEALSGDALAVLSALDTPLRDAHDLRWKDAGPVRPEDMACAIARRELRILATPLTTVPMLADVLSAGGVKSYNAMPGFRQDAFQELLAFQVLDARTAPIGEVSAVAFDGDVDEFVEALQVWAEKWVEANAGG